MKKFLILAIIVVVVIVVGYGFMKSSTNNPYYSNPQMPASNSNPSSSNIYLTKTDSAKGNYMTDFNGMTLYTFDKDANGVSNCSGGCLKIWPLYTSGAASQGTFPENISVITRSDGTKQFAWKGMPLYYYANDAKVGDITGDGVGGIWHIVKL